jgi:predicted PurR-regulated permease PerM
VHRSRRSWRRLADPVECWLTRHLLRRRCVFSIIVLIIIIVLVLALLGFFARGRF